jgi:hypothetical protein
MTDIRSDYEMQMRQLSIQIDEWRSKCSTLESRYSMMQ